MFSPTSAYITAHGIQLHYYRTGGNNPPLVLAHGLTDDGLCWTPIAEVLAETHDVIMVDTRGHGKSDAPKDGYMLTNLATDLAGAIRELALDKPIILGHSLGAITALTLAGMFPDVPRRILLEDPPPFWNFQSFTPQQVENRKGFVDWIVGLKRKTRDELIAEGHQSNPSWPEAEFGPWANAKHRSSPRVAALAFPKDVPLLDFPALFGAVTCPALLISANIERGAISGEDDIRLLKAWMPHLDVQYVAGAGHNIRREQYSEYMKIVQGALAELSEAK